MLVTVASELQMVIVMSALRIGVIRMKNKERYAKEIVELACDGNRIAVDRQTGELRSCYETPCIECLFHSSDTERCRERIRKWAESEYIEKPVIDKKDRVFLEYLGEELKYIGTRSIASTSKIKSRLTAALVINSFESRPADLVTTVTDHPERTGRYHPYVSESLLRDIRSNHTVLGCLPLLFPQCCR